MIERDDLEVGTFFTIDSWKQKQMQSFENEIFAMFPQKKEKWGMGEVFKVVAIQLPFIAVECLSVPDLRGKKFPMDTREVNLIKIGKSYIDALHVTEEAVAQYQKQQKNPLEILFGNGSVVFPADGYEEDTD